VILVDRKNMSTGVLFVCTGNICRSPTAEGVFKAMAQRQGAAIDVDSAGTYGGHAGEPPSKLAIEAAARRGYDLSDLRARLLVAEDVARFDYVLAMDRGHLRVLRRVAPPAVSQRPRLFMNFAPVLKIDEVPDPWGGPRSAYERALDLIEAGCKGLLKHVTMEAAKGNGGAGR
jgi:protein-tyrosine phosphatase